MNVGYESHNKSLPIQRCFYICVFLLVNYYKKVNWNHSKNKEVRKFSSLKKFQRGTSKQFDSGGKIQYWKDVYFYFFSQFLCHMPQRNWIFLSILVVALSDCGKDFFYLSHWVTATNGFLVCRTQSLLQTKLIYVSKKFKIMPRIQKIYNNKKKMPRGTKALKSSRKKSTKKFRVFGPFWHILGNIYKLCLLQWLSATNKKYVCRSDSVR